MAKSFTGTLDGVSHKWRRLAERRQAHLFEMFHSGRWKHYYTEENFLRSMRDSIQLTERWTMIAPPTAETAVSNAAPSDTDVPDATEPNPPRRDAA